MILMMNEEQEDEKVKNVPCNSSYGSQSYRKGGDESSFPLAYVFLFGLVSSWSVCKNCRGDGRRKREIPRTLFACHVKIQGPFAVEGIAAKNTPKYLTPTFWTKPMRQRPNTCKFFPSENSTDRKKKREKKNINIPTPTATQFPKINGDRTLH